ncbi:uncharacterized protein MYCGRDRAFT_82703 [Zymoseptoria tritici IPO323]|uniref:Uncharacterized protein n=1 Tax=Zymoseptoria tritici (strain CBS 115943 / IPO323) TaxID=336722 RepID=F9XM77_ZYMTI|nr:uncharacterized protein MYCGRDRAFT_82703 [Zymoseptoria tritici IPO323]EGP83438.1 hypothetical protein MYCGRDRAFT_82703 [Zymoseptoria tritici IPO323]
MVKITGYDSNSSVIFRIKAVHRLHFAVGVGEAIEQNPIVYEITLYDRAVGSRDGILVMAVVGRFSWESAARVGQDREAEELESVSAEHGS